MVKLLLLGERPNPRGAAVAHQRTATDYINRLEFIRAMGGYLDAQAVPVAERDVYLLVLLGEMRANKVLAERNSANGSSATGSSSDGAGGPSGPGVRDSGWRQRNRTDGVQPSLGIDPRNGLPWAG